ncbi:ribosomal RNA-processing protein 9 [[Emmonsia] crescens]|uniref:Ribosomal RNA-processing protein 9 n=1 Tax=[Emmonsia] crescens TaxID=73230 RepID=A0A2B7ZGX5_9EURO|nr:ribosomal RNA-processing protein 9 [Emmonsia crescens]
MSSFFTLPASQRKRKRDDGVAAPASKKRGVSAKGGGKGAQDAEQRDRRKQRDESISGSESDDDDLSQNEASIDEEEGSEEESEDETAADRRLRLAERYLENIREEVDEVGFDAADIDRDLIADRLKEDVDESKGRIYRQIGSQLSFPTASHAFFRADTQSTSAIAVHSPFVYTVSKDKTLIKWELATPYPCPPIEQNAHVTNGDSARATRPQRKKPKKIKSVRGLQQTDEGGDPQGHTGNILAVAVSPSGQFVATGGADRRLIIWDAETLTPLKTFNQHRDAVSGLSFTRRISSSSSGEQLFSSSFDRTIKTWSLSPGAHAYVETLFGHQDHVIAVDSMALDQCVSVGARDRTARLWKVVDETQLVFRGGSSKGSSYVEGSIDCVAVLPPTHFVTGSDSGAISLWSMHKKKPLYTIHQAHGVDPVPPLDQLSSELDPSVAKNNTRNMSPTPRWITALTTLPGTDIVLSGSWDGWIRAWKISEDKRTILPLGPVGAPSPPTASTVDLISTNNMDLDATTSVSAEQAPHPLLKGVVNDIDVFERRAPDDAKANALKSKSKKGKSNSSSQEGQWQRQEQKGICIVAALGKEHKLGRWKYSTNKEKNGKCGDGTGLAGRNGAVVFEVHFLGEEGGLV